MGNQKKDKTPETSSENKSNWNALSGKIRETFPNVSESDLQFMSKGTDELIGRLQIKTGKTKAQIREWVDRSSKIM